ncbi:hypothetical protein [Parvicella tangerina]|uniref:Uncharacterized protein n=1 Tax=Parvicella tangerina TaxID=2829795 RepID=A0A916N9X5_9FLAO|nr:hypothetical protein [Parvicella tangerina]CAG5079809.1 hypothetical protein CRYO30217_01077 [Parvicella tangerina]
MNRLLGLLVLFFIGTNLLAQSVMLTAEENARMYHVVQKSPVLKRNLNTFFSYSGDTVYFKYFDSEDQLDSIVDYDSIVQHIIYKPSLLQVDHYGLANSSTGLLTELASKMALYQLYRELKDRDKEHPEGYTDKAYEYFMDTLVLKLPNEVTRRKNGIDVPSKQINDLINPNYFFNQRVTALLGIQSLEQVRHKTVIEAINYATRSYLQFKGKEYFSKICHNRPEFETNLLACGDGSNTYGLLDEREKIYKHKNELGDPVGLGLFTYKPKFITVGDNRQQLVPEQSSVISFDPIEKNYTNLHFSLWGFNREQQTTVAVYREDNMYLLYANKLTKELSPDTTFGKGTTLQSLIKQLEEFAIPKVDEEINGEDGVRARLDNRDTSHHECLMEIMETEMELSDLRYNGLKNKKKTKKAQDHLAWLYSRKKTIEKQQKELIEHLKDAEERYARLVERLMELKSYINYHELKYTHFGYVYTFEDGVTFNANTQDLVFPDTTNIKDIEIRLITFGSDAMSQHVDEIQLLTSISKGKPQDFSLHDFSLTFSDLFNSDDYKLDQLSLSPKEHFELSKLLNTILTEKTELVFDLEGNGIGVLMDGKVVDAKENEEDEYPGETPEEKKNSRESEAYKPLRVSYLDFTKKDLTLNLRVASFTDPVRSKFSYRVGGLNDFKQQYDSITDNQLLSAFRTFHLTEQFCRLMWQSTHNDFDKKEASKINNEIKNALYKSKVDMNGLKLRYADYAKLAHPNSDYYDLVVKELEKKDLEIREKLGYKDKKKK